MPRDLSILESESDLDDLLTRSHGQPVLLFKHSRSCGTSAYALEELGDYLARAPERLGCAMVTVQTHRALSDAIAERLGVRHHTPQVLLLKDGRVTWSATHHRITADALDAEVRRLLSGEPAPHLR